jgi:uncharacterized repeat protein (TIGR03803 family)
MQGRSTTVSVECNEIKDGGTRLSELGPHCTATANSFILTARAVANKVSPSFELPLSSLTEDENGANRLRTRFGSHSWNEKRMEHRMKSAKKDIAIASHLNTADSWRERALDFTTGAMYRVLAMALFSVLFFFATQLAMAQTESVLYTFTGTTTGFHPAAGLVRDPEGNLFGTTYQGGNTGCGGLGCGTVFEVTRSGVETVLHTFTGAPDGATPAADLILDTAGNLYGTTQYGGASCCGTVFQLTPTGEETILHSFTGEADGGVPSAGLLRDGEGNLYGTTQYGGASYGTVFELTPGGILKVLYTFTGGADGGAPLGGLVPWNGNFYGTTADGGAFRLGTVFEVTRKGEEIVLHSFSGGSDGVSPFAGLIPDKEGNLYGTTLGGGGSGCSGGGCGTVFEVTQSGAETVLYSFSGGGPVAGLVRDSQGNFYGTTETGGSAFEGTVFKLSPSGVETVLHTFTGGSDGQYPESGLVRVGNAYYGTTFFGGSTDGGTVFKVIP